jgi:hypothetical protein
MKRTTTLVAMVITFIKTRLAVRTIIVPIDIISMYYVITTIACMIIAATIFADAFTTAIFIMVAVSL